MWWWYRDKQTGIVLEETGDKYVVVSGACSCGERNCRHVAFMGTHAPDPVFQRAEWASAYYRALRDRGVSEAEAVREADILVKGGNHGEETI